METKSRTKTPHLSFSFMETKPCIKNNFCLGLDIQSQLRCIS